LWSLRGGAGRGRRRCGRRHHHSARGDEDAAGRRGHRRQGGQGQADVLHDEQAHIREYTLKPLPAAAAPACTRNHSVPGFLFSNSGFSGNLYHDYTDVLVPLFISTHQFRGRVQFLLSGMKPWWVGKFTPFFKQLTKYDVIDVDNDQEVHCFPWIEVGATFHKDMGVDPRRSHSP